jgi:DNA-binding IclR family transcriptional regulator
MEEVKRGKDAEGTDPAERGGGIQSLDRAFAILEEIARHRDGIALSELSRRVGLHNSTTFHLVKTMLTLGYVLQEKESKRYRVGTRVFTLAAGALDDIEMVRAARPIMDELTRLTGECSNFAVRAGENVMILARTGGVGLLQVSERAGVTRPSHCTAPGKVLAAALAPAQLERWLSTFELPRLTPKTLADPALLLRELQTVRQTGIAYDDCEFDPEVRCISVPVYDFSSQVIGAIGISGPIWRLSIQRLHEMERLVRNAGEALSQALGFPGPSGIRQWNAKPAAG